MNDSGSAFERFWEKMRVLYLSSLTCLLLQNIANAWKQSWFYGRIYALLDRRPAYLNSRFQNCLTRWRQWLAKKGTAFCSVLQESRFYRIYRAIFRTGAQSRFLGYFFRGGMVSLLLFFIGGYVVWDYLLRDVLSIPVLSSFWDELLLVFCVLWIIYSYLARSEQMLGCDTPLDMPVLFFLCVCLLLLFIVCPYLGINIAGLRATAQYILWFFAVSRLIRNDRDFKQLYLMMVLIAAVIGLHGIYQYIVGAPIPENWIDKAEASVRTRVYSIFSSCNIMGDFMVMFAPMAAGIAYAAKSKWMKIAAWICTVVMCLSCLLTMSRGAWVAMAVAVIVFAVLVDLRLIFLMVAAGAVAMFLPFVQSRIGYLFTDAFVASANRAGRSVRWATAMQYLFDSNPVLGMGFGMFGGAIAMQNKIHSGLNYFYTDNYYVKILTENGFVGLISFLAMMLGVLWTGLKSWFRTRKSKSRCAPLCAGMFSGLIGVLVHCYFENIFEEPYMAACFWIIAAMMMYLGFQRPVKTKHNT